MFKICVRSIVFRYICVGMLFAIIACGIATMVVSAQIPNDQKEPSNINDKLLWYANQLVEHAEDVTSATAISAIDHIANKVVQVKVDESHSWEGLTVLLDLMIQAKRTFHAVSPSLEDRTRIARQVHFAIDAYVHRYHPLWLQLEIPLKRNVAKVLFLVDKKQFQQAQAAFTEVHQQIHLIHAAMQITCSSDQVSKLDSLLLFLQHEISGSPVAMKQFQQAMNTLNQTLEEMFHTVHMKPTTAPGMERNQLFTGVFLIGGFIIVILTLAAYRMTQMYQLHHRKS